ncbi:energy transducer TonB [Mucilaginibacter sp. AW1-7]|uniref:energy transducer TonB n=1 Tax=Mucilaginibacter sp. AW1-7 TaxID=3349874 RepID=UPI003F732C16
MKNAVILLFVFLLSLRSPAQTKQIIKVDDKHNVLEKYFVLDSNEQIRSGKYEKYAAFNNRLICDGYYQNNVKDSIWTYYSYRGAVALTGFYKNNERFGFWSAFNGNDELQVKYDYTNKKLRYYKLSHQDSLGQNYRVIRGTDTLKVKLDRPIVFLDGERMMQNDLRNLRYPAIAREHHVQGKVIIAFTIDTLGHTSNFRVKSGLGFGCDEESLLGAKRIKGEWLPGLYKGEPVTVEYELPINFTIEED